jgi:putative oxidoreductase|tara:strand:- start:701 stop:1066 length:366 start_codon:yes stop_codon:yes gene_type:complete
MISRILSYIIALIFFVSGGAKLLSLPFEVEAFARWGYPIEFMYFTGVVEFVGAIGLLIPRLSSFASLYLAMLMLGAIGTHIVHKEWSMLAVASVIALAAFWHAWLTRAEVKQLLITLRPNK